jgi:hypothetical protein
MKRLLLILILTFSFQTLAKADDIRDFQIEGMSIGDSLLDYFSRVEIKNSKRYDHTNTSWTSDKMFQLRTNNKGPYTEIMFALKKNDKKYIIYGISGLVKMESNISDCYPKLENISNEFEELFPNAKIKRSSSKHKGDKSKKSKVTSVYFILPSKDFTAVSCYDWSKEMGYWDNFRISITTREFDNWIASNF